MSGGTLAEDGLPMFRCRRDLTVWKGYTCDRAPRPPVFADSVRGEVNRTVELGARDAVVPPVCVHLDAQYVLVSYLEHRAHPPAICSFKRISS